jgi:hypothetical protein
VGLENYRQSSERRMTGRVEIHVKEIIRPSRQRSGCDYGSWHITRTKDQPNRIIDRDATLKLEKKNSLNLPFRVSSVHICNFSFTRVI